MQFGALTCFGSITNAVGNGLDRSTFSKFSKFLVKSDYVVVYFSILNRRGNFEAAGEIFGAASHITIPAETKTL